MAELIDREATYEVLTSFYHHKTDIQHNALREALNKVPSVQPNLQPTCNQLATDYISRQSAIDALGERPMVWTEDNEYDLGCASQYDSDRLAIETVSSADVQPVRHGHWIIKDNPGTGWYRVTCSECGEDVTSVAPVIGFFPKAKVIWDFCPECGTRMDGE